MKSSPGEEIISAVGVAGEVLSSRRGMEKKKGMEDVSPVLVLLAVGLGGLGYWWWRLGDTGRLEWLSAIGYANGYGPVPLEILAQLEWLVMSRLADMEGMAMLFLLAGSMGIMEGNVRRQSVTLSGFGLRLLKTGRVLALVWLACLVVSIIAPVPLAYEQVAGALTILLGIAAFMLARGLRRVQ